MSAQRTYSLAEVAAIVLPAEWRDSERWLARRLNRREIKGYRVGRVWRMTESQVDDLIRRFTNDAEAQPEPSHATCVADGLSARSRRRLRQAS